VIMEGEGLASQLLMAVIELVGAETELPERLGSATLEDGSTLYVYVPNLERIDLDTLREEIDRYEMILTMA